MSAASPVTNDTILRQAFVLVNGALQPVQLPETAGRPMIASVGDGFYGLITEVGELFMAGDNDSGQCGAGSRQIDLLKPQRVILAGSGEATIARSLSTGMRFTIVCTAAGAQAFGGNDYQQLGRPQQKMSRDEEIERSMVPNEDGSISQINPHRGDATADGYLPAEVAKVGVRSVACGLHLGFVVSNDGAVFGCGHAGYGLTEPTPNFVSREYWSFTEKLTRLPIPGDVRIVAVTAETQQAFALTDDGRIVQWGIPESTPAAGGWSFMRKPTLEDKPAFVMPTIRTDISGVEAITADAQVLVRGPDNRTSVYSLGLEGAPKLIAGSEDVIQISYYYALRADGIVLEMREGVFKPSTKLIAPTGQKIVHIANGRCGKPIIITEASCTDRRGLLLGGRIKYFRNIFSE